AAPLKAASRKASTRPARGNARPGRPRTGAPPGGARTGTPPPPPHDVHRVGGHFEHHPTTDPLADLIRAQRLAVTLAESQGQNPDRPRNLTRSVVLGVGGGQD
ncbi:hypothetical protein ACFV3T_15890, partial [Streptomyces albidoflavus]